MGQPSARVTDLAGHGGPITIGESSVLIGGLPAARVGDPFTCPASDGPKPHVAGNIIKGSIGVFIGGANAARMGDPTGCGTAGVIGKSMPPVKGPGPDGVFTGVVAGKIGDSDEGMLIWRKGKEAGKNATGLLWLQAKYYSNAIGASGEAEGSLFHSDIETNTEKIDGKFNASIDFINANVKGGVGIGSGELGVEGSVLKGKLGWQSSQEGLFYGGIGGEFKVLSGKLYAANTMPTGDGRKNGFFGKLAIEASPLVGNVTPNVGANIPIPFTEKLFTASSKIKLEGSAGVEAAGGVYHDKEDGKVHANLSLMFFEIDVMFGIVPKPPTPSTPTGVGIPMIPGTIITGLPSVLIG